MKREDIEECRRWVKEGINTQEWAAEESSRCTRLIDDVCNAALLTVSEREERVPDFEEDFEGAVEAICDQVVDDLKKHPEPEYWIAKSAARLAHFVKIKAPSFIIEGEKRLLQCRVTALPVYCADYDALKSEAGGG